MLARQGLTESGLKFMSPGERDAAVSRFAIRRKIDVAHRGHEHPNLETASRLLAIIKEAPDLPEVERAREYFYHHGIVPGADDLALLSPDQLKSEFGDWIDTIRAAAESLEQAHALLETERYADAVAMLQDVARHDAAVPACRQAREQLREFGMIDIVVSDQNRDEVNDKLGEIMWRRHEWERMERLAHGGQYFEAAKLLHQFRTGAPNTPEAREAEERLGHWGIWNMTLDDDARDAVNEAAKRAEAAWRTFERAERLAHAGKVEQSMRAFLELARANPDSPVGREAAEWLTQHGIAADAAEITDEDLAAAAQRHAARRAHGRVHRLMRGGRYLQAIEAYRQIAADYDGIPEGQEAQRILTECGAWNVEITDQNRDEIVAVLRNMMAR